MNNTWVIRQCHLRVTQMRQPSSSSVNFGAAVFFLANSLALVSISCQHFSRHFRDILLQLLDHQTIIHLVPNPYHLLEEEISNMKVAAKRVPL